MDDLIISDEKVIESTKILGDYCKKLFCSNCEIVCIFGEHFDLHSECPMREFVQYPCDLLKLVNMMERRPSIERIRYGNVVEAAKILGTYCEQHMSTMCGKSCVLAKNVEVVLDTYCPWKAYVRYLRDLLDLTDD